MPDGSRVILYCREDPLSRTEITVFPQSLSIRFTKKELQKILSAVRALDPFVDAEVTIFSPERFSDWCVHESARRGYLHEVTMDRLRYDVALALFSQVSNYKDSAKMITESENAIKYAEITALIEEEDFYSAYSMLEDFHYRDSDKLREYTILLFFSKSPYIKRYTRQKGAKPALRRRAPAALHGHCFRPFFLFSDSDSVEKSNSSGYNDRGRISPIDSEKRRNS